MPYRPLVYRLFSRFDIAFDFACVVIDIVSVSVWHEKGGRFLDSECESLIFVVLGVDDRVGDARFVKHCFCHLAVGASLRRENQKTFVFALVAARALCACFFLSHFDFALGLVVTCKFLNGFAVILRVRDVVHFALFELCAFTVVPVLNGAIVTGDTAVNFRLSATDGASVLFPFEVAVFLADGIGRGERIVGQFVVFCNLSHEICRRLPTVEALTEECVEDRTRSVEGLEFVLNVESGEDIARVSDGKVRTVGVVFAQMMPGYLSLSCFARR